MSIRTVGNQYQADFMKAGVRHRKGFDTEVEAAAWEAEMKRRIALNLSLHDILGGTKKDKTLSDLLDVVFSNVWQGMEQEQNCLYEIKKLNEYFGDVSARALKTTHMDDYVTHLKRLGYKPATLNRKLGMLKQALKYGHDRGWVDVLPKIPRFTTNNERLIFWSVEDEKEIVDAMDALDAKMHNTQKKFLFFKHFLVWSIDTGMRPSESRRLTANQIRFDPNRECYIADIKASQSKTGTKGARSIPLTTRAYAAFEYAQKHNKTSPWAFWDKGQCRRHWDILKDFLKNEDPEFVFYIARHTCASRMVQRGVPITVVKDWMGHSKIETTMIYAKLAPDGLMVGLEALQQ